VPEFGDDEVSPASAKAGPKLAAACDGEDDDCDDVSDWIASSASEAAPIAGSMARLRNGAVYAPSAWISKPRATVKSPMK
jgi:hypothetical protein